jgi:branched-chain amino acid transport system substrate-binding protein
MKKGLWKVFGVVVALSFIMMIPSASFAQAKGPIKIGFISPLSGGMAANGKDMLTGIELYLEEIGHQAAGRKIELIVEDDEAVPATGLTKTRKLVEKDGVHIMTGGLMASTGYALPPYIDSKEIPMTYPIMAPDDLTQRKTPKWIIRTGWASCQPHQPFGEYAYHVLKFKKIAVIAYDFAFGWECVGGFHKVFEDSGGKILQKIWVPLTAKDFSPYLSQFSKDADAIFAVFSGQITMQFCKQYQEFGPKGKVPLIGGGTVTDEHALPQMGDEAIGVITPLHYSLLLFRRDLYGSQMDCGGHQVHQRGRREQRQVDGSFEKGGELQNTVIQTYPNVSQFWKSKPEDFLKQPVYSREYPPVKP